MPLVAHFQDLLMFILVLVLLTLVARAITDLFRDVTKNPLDVVESIADALYVFVIIEFIEILLEYIRERRIAVDFMIEVAIISSLREVIGHGLSVYSWDQLLAVAAFLLTLGVLLRFGRFQEKRLGNTRQTARQGDHAVRPADEVAGSTGAGAFARTGGAPAGDGGN
jgi:uncharacterized membrane protein (DUF373 family)